MNKFILWLAIQVCSLPIIFSNYITADMVLPNDFIKDVDCKPHPAAKDFDGKCIDENRCKRRIVDGLFSENDITKLHDIAKKGMSTRESIGGPTILDINTGFIRDSLGLDNLFALPNDLYTSDDFQHYASIISRLKQAVMETFSINTLYFTAPTFITRIDATRPWTAREIHDEYWHAHADRNNTPHYHYSGLLYMSTYQSDFTGGRLRFYDANKYDIADEDDAVDLIMEPRQGRVVIFSSGHENVHRVEEVHSGQRYVLSFWFTCDPQKEFEIFLDGQAHVAFSRKIKQAIASKKSRI